MPISAIRNRLMGSPDYRWGVRAVKLSAELPARPITATSERPGRLEHADRPPSIVLPVEVSAAAVYRRRLVVEKWAAHPAKMPQSAHRDVNHAIPRVTHAEGQIDVLVVEKESRVEQADLLHQGPR